MELASFLAALNVDPAGRAAETAAIGEAVLARSPLVSEPNFSRIGTSDLQALFELYDERFFAGLLQQTIGSAPDTRLRFRLAPRMTQAGGKTCRFRTPGGRDTIFEIAISTHLLFTNFRSPDEATEVNGLRCANRLEALQRIFEHELVHLTEFLLTGSSSCKAKPFRDLAGRLFGHQGVTHVLQTARERAAVDFGLSLGDTVAFTFEGRRHVGVLNRITKRATVLVADAAGRRYSDGGRYLKFYVPLSACEKVERA